MINSQSRPTTIDAALVKTVKLAANRPNSKIHEALQSGAQSTEAWPKLNHTIDSIKLVAFYQPVHANTHKQLIHTHS